MCKIIDRLLNRYCKLLDKHTRVGLSSLEHQRMHKVLQGLFARNVSGILKEQAYVRYQQHLDKSANYRAHMLESAFDGSKQVVKSPEPVKERGLSTRPWEESMSWITRG